MDKSEIQNSETDSDYEVIYFRALSFKCSYDKRLCILPRNLRTHSKPELRWMIIHIRIWTSWFRSMIEAHKCHWRRNALFTIMELPVRNETRFLLNQHMAKQTTSSYTYEYFSWWIELSNELDIRYLWKCLAHRSPTAKRNAYVLATSDYRTVALQPSSSWTWFEITNESYTVRLVEWHSIWDMQFAQTDFPIGWNLAEEKEYSIALKRLNLTGESR